MTRLSDLLEQESARLANLSPMELARLLDLSVVEAQTCLERAESIPFMQLTIQEVRHLRASGQLYKKFPELIRVPEDIEVRWRRLKKLFLDDPEFTAKYPEAHELLFGEEVVEDPPEAYPYPWHVNNDGFLRSIEIWKNTKRLER